MSGFKREPWFFPIRQFVNIVPDQITSAFNDLITDINRQLQLLGQTSAPTVTMKQLRNWAINNGSPTLYILQIDAEVPADITSPVNIAWFHANTMTEGDVLYNFIMSPSVLNFTSAQMLAALTAMGTYPP